MAGSETPGDLGLDANALWDYLSPRHVAVKLNDGRTTEAVLLLVTDVFSLYFLPDSVLPEGAARISVPAEVDEGQDPTLRLVGGFVQLAPTDHEILQGPEVTTATFSELGFTPSLGAVVVAVPLASLPCERRGARKSSDQLPRERRLA